MSRWRQEHAEPAGLLAGRSQRYHKISYSNRVNGSAVGRSVHRVAPDDARQIVLDLDATDTPARTAISRSGSSHGYYDSYCYLPLYIFAGEPVCCAARLRRPIRIGPAGSLEEVSRIVTQLRQRWPEVSIVLRADSGFCREELMACANRIMVDHYVFGLAAVTTVGKDHRRPDCIRLQLLHQSSGKAAGLRRVQLPRPVKEVLPARPRGGARLNISTQGENPRFCGHFIKRPSNGPRSTYTKSSYCARGEMENRIKEQM